VRPPVSPDGLQRKKTRRVWKSPMCELERRFLSTMREIRARDYLQVWRGWANQVGRWWCCAAVRSAACVCRRGAVEAGVQAWKRRTGRVGVETEYVSLLHRRMKAERRARHGEVAVLRDARWSAKAKGVLRGFQVADIKTSEMSGASTMDCEGSQHMAYTRCVSQACCR
jgi:hypothetical protein